MTPEEKAKEIYEREESNFKIVFPDKSLPSFVMEAAKNTAAECEMRRKEFWRPTDLEYTEGYWQRVKEVLEQTHNHLNN